MHTALWVISSVILLVLSYRFVLYIALQRRAPRTWMERQRGYGALPQPYVGEELTPEDLRNTLKSTGVSPSAPGYFDHLGRKEKHY